MSESVYDRLWNCFEERALSGGGTALITEKDTIDWLDFFARLKSTMKAFEDSGVQAGDVVLLEGDYSIPMIVAFFALSLNQNIIIPVTNYTPVKEMEINSFCPFTHHIKEFDGGLTVTDCKNCEFDASFSYAEKLKSLQNENKAGLVLLSSGTSGPPKIILHDLTKLLDKKCKPKSNSLNRILILLLFDHIGGINTLISTFLSGGISIIPNERTANCVGELIEKHSVRTLPSSPTFLNLMLISNTQNKFDLSSLKLITYGSEYMPEDLLKRCRSAFPKVRFIQTYGTTETGIVKTNSVAKTGTFFKIGDDNDTYKVIDGELYIRSRDRFVGYLNRDDKVDDSGWFRTGDIVEVTDDSYIRIIGRKDDIINIGGEKVFPVEVESELLKLDFVQECRVYSKENILVGNNVCADIVVYDKMSKAEAREQIFNIVGPRLDSYKLPTTINIVSEIGLTERLKLNRNHS